MTTYRLTALAALAAAGLVACGSGDDGAAGPAGEPGEAGERGSEGSGGPAGPAGPSGAEGSEGAEGAPGDPGLTDEERDQLLGLLTTDGNEACDGIDLDPPDDGEGVQLEFGVHFPAFFEDEKCAFVRVPDEGWNYNGQDIIYTAGSHHVIVWRTPYTEIPQETTRGTAFSFMNEPIARLQEGQPFDCGGSIGGGPSAILQLSGVFAGSQNPEWTPGRMPADTAVPIEGGTYILINAHFLNASAEGLDTCMKLNLYTIPDADVKNRAEILFWYNPFIKVPAQGTSSITAECPLPVDFTLWGGVQSHMHSRGSGYVANLNAPDGTFIEELFATDDWETPIPVDFEPDGKKIAAGSTIDWTCHYNNAEDRNVYQGLETTDEMCMFIAWGYPDDPAAWDNDPYLGQKLRGCTDPARYSSGFNLARMETGGTHTCVQAVQAWMAADAACNADPSLDGCDGANRFTLTPRRQDAIVDSCAPTEAMEYLRCAGANSGACSTACQANAPMDLYIAQCTESCMGSTTAEQAACQSGENLAAHQATCTRATPMAAYTEACQGTCATECAEPTDAECGTCMEGCVGGHVTQCITDRVTACVTEAVTACVTPCATEKVTSCTMECLQTLECEDEWDACTAITSCD